MAEQPPPVMTASDLAGLLALDMKKINRLAEQGILPTFKMVGNWRFHLQDIQRWIDERKPKPRASQNGSKNFLKGLNL
jgi:hypothetical protein